MAVAAGTHSQQVVLSEALRQLRIDIIDMRKCTILPELVLNGVQHPRQRMQLRNSCLANGTSDVRTTIDCETLVGIEKGEVDANAAPCVQSLHV